MSVIPSRATHAGKLERWLGRDTVEALSASMKDWHGPPIAVAGVPGNVWLGRGGDYRGRIMAGAEATAWDVINGFGRRLRRGMRRTMREHAKLNAGFASLSDLISEMTTGGKGQQLAWTKTGPTKVVGSASSLWRVGTWPAAGTVGAAAPGGTAYTSATTGALAFNNPAVGGDTTHLVGMQTIGSLQNSLLLYDRLFAVAKTINSTLTEAVTGVPTRYQNTTAGQPDSIAGNFLSVHVTATSLANTAHNWTVCTYTDQTGAASTLPSVAGNPGAVATIADRVDLPNGTFFAPLETGDTGIKALTQMQCSALVATGSCEFVIGHPLAFQPIPLANVVCLLDGINSAFNLVRIFDNACLAFMELAAPATTATTYTGSVSIVSG